MGGAPWPWVGGTAAMAGGTAAMAGGTAAKGGALWPWVGHRGHGWGHRD